MGENPCDWDSGATAVHWPPPSRCVSSQLCRVDVGIPHPPAQVHVPRITKIPGFLLRLSTVLRLDAWESRPEAVRPFALCPDVCQSTHLRTQPLGRRRHNYVRRCQKILIGKKNQIQDPIYLGSHLFKKNNYIPTVVPIRAVSELHKALTAASSGDKECVWV